MEAKGTLAGLAAIGAMYALAVLLGFKIKDLSAITVSAPAGQSRSWVPPPESSLWLDQKAGLIRRGQLIFDETPLYAKAFTGAKISCSSCHAHGGMQPFASPMVGLPALFPLYSERAGRMISLKDRVQECFVRSENGVPLDYDGETMRSILAYIDWVSQPQPQRLAFHGRGLMAIPRLAPHPGHGAQVYLAQCAGCHGRHGEGSAQFPALWGKDSFNDGAGMHSVEKMAAFVMANMPENRKGILSAQQAWDVAAFIHQQPRPAFDQAYAHF